MGGGSTIIPILLLIIKFIVFFQLLNFVKKLLADNHIICIFIPAGCSDIYQVMDVVVL
jgi:hypothetical protein